MVKTQENSDPSRERRHPAAGGATGGRGQVREIKFRAWDKKNKMMLLNDSLSTHFISFNGSIGVHDNCGNVKYNDGESFVSEKIIPMQYTGLKDKNGKEIYEGDILRLNGIYPRTCGEKLYDITGVVFHEKSGMWKVDSKFAELMLDYYLGRYEVIGNIHENPELLNTPQAAQS